MLTHAGLKRFKRVVKLCHNQKTCEAREEDQADMDLDGDGAGAPKISMAGGCGCKQPKVTRNKEEGKCLQILVEHADDQGVGASTDDRKQVVTAEECYKKFRQISLEDMYALGFDGVFTKPEWLIITVLPVPPLAVRPMVERDGRRSHDDITYMLVRGSRRGEGKARLIGTPCV
jgi:DNA-directed RNA polymerase II subunit RPB1